MGSGGRLNAKEHSLCANERYCFRGLIIVRRCIALEFLNLIQKALSEEAQAQRLYAAMLLLAPSEEDKSKLLELFKDENDHSVILEDMLVKYTTGKQGKIAANVGGVE